MNFSEMKEVLAERIKKSRYAHSLGVSEAAVFLAGRFGVDLEKARIAGLLHDCAREYRNEAMLSEADRRGISYGDV